MSNKNSSTSVKNLEDLIENNNKTGIFKEIIEQHEMFLKEFPLQRLEKLELIEYTNLNKSDSFCYWVEYKLNKLGAIGGYNAYKFGIFRSNESNTLSSDNRFSHNDKYSWRSKYGETVDEVFKNIRNNIVLIAKAAQSGEYEKIDNIDIDNMFKWKVAFLYSNMKLLHIYKIDTLRYLAEKYKMENAKSAKISEIQRFLISSYNGKNLYEYGEKLWKEWVNFDENNKTEIELHEQNSYAHTNIKKYVQLLKTKKNIILQGAPGTGKTSIGKSIAEALGREYVRISLGGIRDEADIRGHRRTYIGAMPGRIMDGMKKAGTSNPVMVLDEIDKLASSYNGDPASALLEVLDPEQNNTFTDHYMNVPYDLSDVLFVCTANSLDTIPGPLLDRMEIIRFTGYTALEKFSIAKEHLIPKAKKKSGIKDENLIIEDETVKALINGFTMEAGVRGLKKQISSLCRYAAVKLVQNNNDVLNVKPEDLSDYLDQRPIKHESILEKKQAGVVTGLAWTAVGGEILFIETMLTKGKGNIKVTGQLGDVMKESVDIALSLVKNMYPDKAEVFEKNDIHIHVPAGAVPKDGPSAGITMTTALSSLVNNIPVSPEYAMTGEVSLRGNVMPIGGLPEKLMAAARAGIKKVFIPDENKDDLKEVAEEDLEEEIRGSSCYRKFLQKKFLI